MRRLWLFSLLVGMFLPNVICRADDTGEVPMRYKMDYVVESFLRQKDTTLHFVNVDLEWPSWLNATRPPVLMYHLASKLFGVEDLTVEACLKRYLDSLGKPLTAVPDDDGQLKRVYHSVELRAIEYSEARYVSFRVKATHRKGESSELDSVVHHIFTYDMVNDKILSNKDLVKKSCFGEGVSYYDFMTLVRLNTPSEYWEDEAFYNMGSPKEICLMHDGLVCDLGIDSYYDINHVLTYVPYSQVHDYYSKSLKKLLQTQMPLNPTSPRKFSTQNEDVDTTAVYDVVEENPVFLQGQSDLAQFMAQQLKFPPIEEMLEIRGKVVVQFIVERDGSVSTIAVLQPASPGYDREAVRVVRMMPKWKPGKVKGKTVRTRMTLPVIWRPQ